MNFDDLCRDFDRRRPKGPIVGEIPWFNVKWENGNDSVNDLLVRALKQFGINDYLRTLNGDIWFIYGNVWTRCTYEVKEGKVHFFMCKFIDN